MGCFAKWGKSEILFEFPLVYRALPWYNKGYETNKAGTTYE